MLRIVLPTLIMMLLLGQWLVLSFNEPTSWQHSHGHLPASEVIAYGLYCMHARHLGWFHSSMHLLVCYPTAWHGADLDTRLAQALAAVPQLADEPELSHASVGLTDKLLGAGQYGQTMLVSFWFFPLLYGHLHICCMATNIILGEKQVHTLSGSCRQLAAELKHQALL